MIAVVCTSCKNMLQVIGELSEVDHLVGQRSEFWPDKYKCFACGGSATGFLMPQISAAALGELNVHSVTAAEAFAALNGLGLPEERTCCADVIVPMLESLGLKVKGKEFRGTARYFLDELELPDGTKLFFGASPYGAAIYRITKPHSYREANDVG